MLTTASITCSLNRATGERISVRSQDALGADGARSKVLAQAGLDVEGPSGVVSRVAPADGDNPSGQLDADVGIRALTQKHIENIVGRAIAKELAERLLVPRDAVLFDQH